MSNLSKKEILRIAIYDAQGKQVLTENNPNVNVVKTSKLINGLYTIELTLVGNSVVYRKLIKENPNR